MSWLVWSWDCVDAWWSWGRDRRTVPRRWKGPLKDSELGSWEFSGVGCVSLWSFVVSLNVYDRDEGTPWFDLEDLEWSLKRGCWRMVSQDLEWTNGDGIVVHMSVGIFLYRKKNPLNPFPWSHWFSKPGMHLPYVSVDLRETSVQSAIERLGKKVKLVTKQGRGRNHFSLQTSERRASHWIEIAHASDRNSDLEWIPKSF